MFEENNKIEFGSDHTYPNPIFKSPAIPYIPSSQLSSVVYTLENHQQQQMDKLHWICDYSDDIFQTMRECENKRVTVWFRSQQVAYRPMLLQLMKDAAEKHGLARTTLHLAVYFLDGFMDNYTIQADKLNLSVVACLILAAKIEEADMDIPKFSELNKLSDKAFTLAEFKNVECKVLETFNYELIRPTAANFAEYFANGIVTLQDYLIYVNHWNNEMVINEYHEYQQMRVSEQQPDLHYIETTPHAVISTPCPYNSYEEMLTTLNKPFFTLIDVSLNYIKFANARPSIICSSCIAAVRQMHGIFPIWTPYLTKLTACSADVISPFVEAILTLYRLHCNNERLQYLQTPNTPINYGALTSTNILCDSPDSGIVSGNDTNLEKSDTEDDNEDKYENVANDTDGDEEEPYYCLEYPLLPKRRRLF